MYSHRIRIALAALLLGLLIPASAQAYTLGAGDGQPEAAPLAAQLGARTYRLVMDPAVPLDAYAPRIEAFRALGMRPQIVVGGTGTSNHASMAGVLPYAVAAFRRWPDTFSVSVVNEPDGSGVGVCEYGKFFRRSYATLKAIGVPRVLFGEWTPFSAASDWTQAILTRCGIGRIVADGFAWHPYDNDPSHVWGMGHAKALYRTLIKPWRRVLRTPRGYALPMYATEFGAPVRNVDERGGVKLWQRAFAVARPNRKQHWPGLAQIVAWQILPTGSGSAWDTSTRRADGSPRPAFGVIARASRV